MMASCARPLLITASCKKEYEKLKKTFKSDAHNAAKIVTLASFLSFDKSVILSTMLGTFSSTVYTRKLVEYVDNIDENIKFPAQLFIPVFMIFAETAINNATDFDLNFIQTICAFMCYKYALMKQLYDSIRSS